MTSTGRPDRPPDETSTGPDSEPSGSHLNIGDSERGRSRLLSRQCETCIFRPGNPMDLSPGRLRALVDQAHAEGGFIICHDTLPYHRFPDAKPAICRGFHDRYHTQTLDIIARLWGFTEVDPPA
jgi:hypothetical protein